MCESKPRFKAMMTYCRCCCGCCFCRIPSALSIMRPEEFLLVIAGEWKRKIYTHTHINYIKHQRNSKVHCRNNDLVKRCRCPTHTEQESRQCKLFADQPETDVQHIYDAKWVFRRVLSCAAPVTGGRRSMENEWTTTPPHVQTVGTGVEVSDVYIYSLHASYAFSMRMLIYACYSSNATRMLNSFWCSAKWYKSKDKRKTKRTTADPKPTTKYKFSGEVLTMAWWVD